ncbi:U box domain [Macleaya cordata]|uniref:RING-type E3 ubiquitin transferase n=1 Tax=Macleaya cordata TaxID=56857 RepID=A0A200Q951_MACCD|nr:U box domain [Macleaya cordata]
MEDKEGSSSVVVYLQRTADQLLNEGKPLKLSQDLMERVLIDRCFSGQFHGAAEPTFPYLIGCYRRAYEEETKLTSMDMTLQWQWAMKSLLRQAKKLAVSYCRIHIGNNSSGRLLNSDMDSNDESPLMPLLLSEVSCSIENNKSVGGLDCPPGFLKQFLEDSDFDSSNLILKSLYEGLSRRAIEVTLMGNFQQPLRALIHLVKFPFGAKALVNHPRWLPKGAHVNGLEIEKMSILGPFFHASIILDYRQMLPSDILGCESNVRSCFRKTIRTLTNELHGGLEEVLLSLLKNNDTQENVFEYLAEIIEQNSSMANIQADPTCASLGMFVNLSAVMLRLCKTFLDKDSTKRGEIDGKYVFYNTRLDCSRLTSLHATSEDVAAWIDKDKLGNTDGSNRMSKSEEATNSGRNMDLASMLSKAKPMTTSSAKTKYAFNCECFFMTARVLHLGLIKALSDIQHIHQKVVTYKGTMSTLKAMPWRGPSRQLKKDIELLEMNIELYWQKLFCYSCQILQHKAFLQQALSFYRLMVVWLVDLVGGFKMPLPSSCPMEFACMPEQFVEDAIELLIVVLMYPNLLGRISLDEFMNFIIMFMASPNYIRNFYLRERMVEVLSWCIPNKSSSSTISIFEDNQLCLEYLVRNLLKLYVGNELTGSPAQVILEFRFRNNIIGILEHLWEIPSHCNAWRQIAKEDTGFYLVFSNIVISEIMFLLDKSFHIILGLEEMEAEMLNTAEWELGPFQKRHERALNIYYEEDMIRDNMSHMMANVGMLAFTSEQITVPFLLPQMVDIVATMLNYILLHLVGLHGKSFRLKHPKKYGYQPEILLNKIVSIYVHLARGDGENIFPAAISKDSRSYCEQLFTDAAAVVLHEDRSVIQEFIELGTRAKFAASKAMDTEAALGEIPRDFLDPIEFTLMEDPVILPSTKTVDRAVILRHLLNYNTDPFSALPLTQHMIIPNVELKAKIEKFIRSKRSEETMLSGINSTGKDQVRRDENSRGGDPKAKDAAISTGLQSILQNYGSDDESQ